MFCNAQEKLQKSTKAKKLDYFFGGGGEKVNECRMEEAFQKILAGYFSKQVDVTGGIYAFVPPAYQQFVISGASVIARNAPNQLFYKDGNILASVITKFMVY